MAPTARPLPLQNLALSLLESWQQGILPHRLTHDHPGLASAFLCPACARCHGRSIDFVYPLVALADQSQNHAGLAIAEALLQWTQRNLTLPGGGWVNDKHLHLWQGTTVFAATGLAESMFFHGNFLKGSSLYPKLQEALWQLGQFVFKKFTPQYGNLNFLCAAPYFLTLAGQLLQQPTWLKQADNLANHVLSHCVSPAGWLVGEGKNTSEPTHSDSFHVDLAYNVDVSLPALVLYGQVAKRPDIQQALVPALQTHLHFMLPDGAWDNSWGTRIYKWSWWGTRTGDGSAIAYALMAEHNPAFYTAAQRQLELWQFHTHDHLLQPFPHGQAAGEETCLEHTLTHAKTLARILDHPCPSPPETLGPLPREQISLQEHREINTHLVTIGPWTATMTAYAHEYKRCRNTHALGGVLTLLWHQNLGPLLVGGMTDYQMIEASNMVMDRSPIKNPLTPHLQLTWQGQTFYNLSDATGSMQTESRSAPVQIRCHQRLLNLAGYPMSQETTPAEFTYQFRADGVEICLQPLQVPLDADLLYILPIILSQEESWQQLSATAFQFQKKGGRLNLSANKPMHLVPMTHPRLFHPVPGFQALPVALPMNFIQSEARVRLYVA